MKVAVGREDCSSGCIKVPKDYPKVGYNYNMFERLHQENQSMWKSYLLVV